MQNMQWYRQTTEEVLNSMAADVKNGLNSDQVKERQSEYGYNKLPQKKPKTLAAMFADQFKDFMIIILLIASAVSLLLGEITDAVVIILIVILNSILGVVQESKAEKSLQALKKLTAPTTKVKRNGYVDVIPSAELVPGDIVLVEAGSFIPADLRLVEGFNLKIDESSLTGESVPVDKSISSIKEEDISLGDMENMAFMSTIVTYGKGEGVVVDTGSSTQVGKIAGMIQDEKGVRTPLQRRLEELGKWLGTIVLGLCGLIFLVGVLYGKEVFGMFMTAVSLAVAAIPEGLPAIVTVVLAIGVQRMIKRNAIIRKLPAVETLGCATVICSDKTGTLTQNKMTVKKIYIDDRIIDAGTKTDYTQGSMDDLISISFLCNNTKVNGNDAEQKFIGEPTEIALMDLAYKSSSEIVDKFGTMTRIHEIPFDSDRKMMSTIYELNGGKRVYTKGAPDRLIDKCRYISVDGRIQELTETHIKKIEDANENMAENAFRVLGLAYKDLDAQDGENSTDHIEKDLVFVGLAGLIDPPRPEAKKAVKLCKKAGIKPVMITGDHKITAVAIAKSLGILNDENQALTGVELEKMSDEELEKRVKDISVYARVSPAHKVRIVKAWQKWGEIVAMTGDGVNDAPALKRADIGAAMGQTGTDVAKESAEMVLTDDNFATIVSAIKEGRLIYSNIVKSIQFLLSCNTGEILTLFIATVMNWHMPLIPIQILWVNLVTDSLPALSLGVEPAEKGIMDQSPRNPKAGVFSGGLAGRIIYQGVIIGLITLTAFRIGLTESVEHGRTMAFLVLSFSQLIHVYNIRSSTVSLFKMGPFTNKYLLGATLISGMLQIMVIIVPFLRSVFRVVLLSPEQWYYIIGLCFVPLVVVELIKFIKYRGNTVNN